MLKIPGTHLLKEDYTALTESTGRGGGGGLGGGGEGNSIVFHLSSLTHSSCQYDVT